jgi:hypothetical protein
MPGNKVSEIISNAIDYVQINLFTISNAVSASLPHIALKSFSDANLYMEIVLPQGRMAFGKAALAGIVQNAENADIKITARTVGAVSGRIAYELTVYNGQNIITNFYGPIGVSLPYTLMPWEDPDAVVAYSGNINGVQQVIRNSNYADGRVSFTTTSFSIKMVGYNPVAFNDITNHWARSPVTRAGARDLISGYPNGSFNPDAHVTRAEFIQLIYNVLNLPVHNPATSPSYIDVTDKMWYYNAIIATQNAGLLYGLSYPDGSFRPNDPITRQEMADVLAKIAVYYGVKPINNVSATIFTDYTEIWPHSVNAVEIAINSGLLNENGMGDGTFSPKGYVTRAQAATIQVLLLRIIGTLH